MLPCFVNTVLELQEAVLAVLGRLTEGLLRGPLPAGTPKRVQLTKTVRWSTYIYKPSRFSKMADFRGNIRKNVLILVAIILSASPAQSDGCINALACIFLKQAPPLCPCALRSPCCCSASCQWRPALPGRDAAAIRLHRKHDAPATTSHLRPAPPALVSLRKLHIHPLCARRPDPQPTTSAASPAPRWRRCRTFAGPRPTSSMLWTASPPSPPLSLSATRSTGAH